MRAAGTTCFERQPWLRIALTHGRSVLAPLSGLGFVPNLVLGVVVFAQDSMALRRLGVSSSWDSLAEIMLVVSLVTSLVWALANRPEALEWEARLCRAHATLVTARVAGLFGALIISQGGIAIAMLTLERMFLGVGSVPAACDAFVRATACGLPLAALAPCFVAFSPKGSTSVLFWLLIVASSAGVFGLGVPIPLDRFASLGQPGIYLDARLVASITASTLGGVLVSIFLTLREPTPHRI